MKILLKSITAAVLLSLVVSFIPFQAQCKEISNDVFRLHIIANSDSAEDQNLKIKVRNAVLKETDSLYENAESKQQAIELTKENLDKILKTAQKTISECGFDYSVSAEITNMYFNTRHYDSVTMPSGNYDALQITIGKAQGQNWWCVMYPSLCVGAATNYEALKENTTEEEYNILNSSGEYEYKFLLLECIQKIGKFFAGDK